MWAPIREYLPAPVRTIAPDLPGHGARADRTFELTDAADLVLEDLTSRADGDAIVVGHSLGGYVALELARRAPERVASLVLSGASVEYRGALAIKTRLASPLLRLGGSIGPVDGYFRRRTERRLRALDLSDETVDEVLAGGVSLGAWGAGGRALIGYPSHEVVGDLERPVSLVNGSEDELNVGPAAWLANEHAHVRAETVDGAGHAVPLERPRAFAETVRSAIGDRRR